MCLVARRLVERGVRFIQIFHGGGGGGAWDAHSEIKSNHTSLSEQVDQPIAGLLKDLKRRGMLEDTLVVFGTEFIIRRASRRGLQVAESKAGFSTG
jgi:hypothetical protein